MLNCSVTRQGQSNRSMRNCSSKPFQSTHKNELKTLFIRLDNLDLIIIIAKQSSCKHRTQTDNRNERNEKKNIDFVQLLIQINRYFFVFVQTN